MNFPTYESKFGSIVGKYLRGEFGKREDIPLEIRCLLYAMDRYQYKEEYENFLKKDGIIVANRYTYSNIFQIVDSEEKLIDWIENVERRLPKADVVIFLDIPPKIAYELHEQKMLRTYIGNKERDIQERDFKLQQNAYKTYQKLSEKRDNWIKIKCIKNGELRGVEEINKNIWKEVKDIID